jgi:hypothetical protein
VDDGVRRNFYFLMQHAISHPSKIMVICIYNVYTKAENVYTYTLMCTLNRLKEIYHVDNTSSY